MPKAKATHKNTLEVVANPRTEKMITPKQEEFCRLYVCEDISQTEAALKAGYSKKSAHAIASQLLNGQRYPHVVNRIRELKIELSKKYEVTFEGHVQKLAQIRDEALANGNYPAAVAAETKRGQAAGQRGDRTKGEEKTRGKGGDGPKQRRSEQVIVARIVMARAIMLS